jgi:hypothetical protein
MKDDHLKSEAEGGGGGEREREENKNNRKACILLKILITFILHSDI